MTAAEIVRAIRSGSLCVTEAVDAAFARIAATDTRLNAFTELMPERARARAARVDAALAAGHDPGPLVGVPFAAKDLFDVAGIVTRAGAKVTANDPPAARDAELITALEAQGAILVGVTNMDEFAYGFTTENAHFGATRNPHALDRIAGGSSGGSAAAVAGGLVPLAIGTDTNGSIRVPAALCGIFGIRPTLGKLSRRGAYPFVNSLDTVGPFARTAADLTAAYAALDPSFASRPSGDLSGVRAARLGGYFARGLTAETQAALERVCAAIVTEPELLLPEAMRAREAAFVITSAEGGELHAQRLRRHADQYDPATRDRLIAGSLVPAAWYIRAQRFRSWFHARALELFAQADVLVAPVTAHAATLIGQRTIVLDGVETEIRPNVGVFTQPLTLAGFPIVAVPVVEPGVLPAGVQLVGRPGSEALLLALAEDLERRGVVGAQAIPALA